MRLSSYETTVLTAIARHQIEPGILQKVMRLSGKPFERLYAYARHADAAIVRKLTQHAHDALTNALFRTVRLGGSMLEGQVVRDALSGAGIVSDLPADVLLHSLEARDRAAESLRNRSRLALTGQGAAMGAATAAASMLPFSAVALPAAVVSDIALATTLLARHAAELAACYGYSPASEDNVPHLIAAMAPEQTTSDEGFLAGKALVGRAIRESGTYLAQMQAAAWTQQVVEQQAPHLVRLIYRTGDRLGLVFVRKQLVLLLPVAGALINGGFNVAFQRVGYENVRCYFRRLVLEEKYGVGAVREALSAKIAEMQQERTAA